MIYCSCSASSTSSTSSTSATGRLAPQAQLLAREKLVELVEHEQKKASPELLQVRLIGKKLAATYSPAGVQYHRRSRA